MSEIIQDLKLSVDLPKKVLQNLEAAGYLDAYTDYSGSLVIRSYRVRTTLKKTIEDIIIEKWK